MNLSYDLTRVTRHWRTALRFHLPSEFPILSSLLLTPVLFNIIKRLNNACCCVCSTGMRSHCFRLRCAQVDLRQVSLNPQQSLFKFPQTSQRQPINQSDRIFQTNCGQDPVQAGKINEKLALNTHSIYLAETFTQSDTLRKKGQSIPEATEGKGSNSRAQQ